MMPVWKAKRSLADAGLVVKPDFDPLFSEGLLLAKHEQLDPLREAYRLRIMDKLQIDNVARLTKYAIQEGITSAEP